MRIFRVIDFRTAESSDFQQFAASLPLRSILDFSGAVGKRRELLLHPNRQNPKFQLGVLRLCRPASRAVPLI
jgi:hypothetical protein